MLTSREPQHFISAGTVCLLHMTPELAPSKLTHHCVVLGGIIHPHRVQLVTWTRCSALARCSAVLTWLYRSCFWS